ncbi:MAG: hypothetical protein ABJB66_08725, partial [Gemmatimonadaceae bacterium]
MQTSFSRKSIVKFVTQFGRVVTSARAHIAGIVLVAACSGGDSTRQSAAVVSTAGALMGTAVVGTTLDAPVHFVVTDEMGEPAPFIAVHFAASGDGRLSSADVLSDNAGVVETRWTLGTKAGMQTVQMAVPGLPLQLFTANAIADHAATVQLNVA